MTETQTSRFGLWQWSADSDSPNRIEFGTSFANIEARAAYDDGVTAVAPPVTGSLAPARYALVKNAAYATLYRRNDAAGWDAVGGNTDPGTRFFRPAAGSSTTGKAWEVSHPDITNPTAWATYDGSTVLSGRLAVYEQNPSGANPNGVLHVGSTAAADPVNLGRTYVRTRADADRGVVIAAHGAGAGSLLTIRESGGTDPLTVSAAGRLRAQVPVGMGGVVPADGVPLGVSPTGTSDSTGLAAYGLTGGTPRPGLKVFRSLADTVEIARFLPDEIDLGRDTWAGGLISLKAPNVAVTGALTVHGATDLDDVVMAALTADSGAIGGALTAHTVATTGPTTVYGGELPILGVDDLDQINTDPRTGQVAFNRLDYTWMQYTGPGTGWVTIGPAGGGTTLATRHEARYIKSVNQNVPTGDLTFTPIKFESAGYATNDITVAGGGIEFVFQRPGVWTVDVTITLDTGPPGLRWMVAGNADFSKRYCGQSIFQGSSTGWSNLSASRTMRFGFNDVIVVGVIQTSGVSLATPFNVEQCSISLTWQRA